MLSLSLQEARVGAIGRQYVASPYVDHYFIIPILRDFSGGWIWGRGYWCWPKFRFDSGGIISLASEAGIRLPRPCPCEHMGACVSAYVRRTSPYRECPGGVLIGD